MKNMWICVGSILLVCSLLFPTAAKGDPPSLADFWTGTARFQNEERVRFPRTPYNTPQDFYFNTHDSGMTVIQDPQNPSNIYYLAESWYINSGNLEPHIYRSTDGGLNFNHLTAIFNIADRDDPSTAAIPATILTLTTFSPGVMKMVIDAPDFANRYHPEATVNLTLGAWGNVPHSTNGLAPFIVTNLAYSVSKGTSEVIYVETDDANQIFKVIGE